jgi:hypothetical protein
MKNILYILLTLSILSIGCSKEDDVQITQEVTNNLDENLYGEWKLSGVSSYRSFSSNGKWGSWTIQSGVPYSENSGDWWVENDQVLCQYNSSSNTYVMDYSVSGNTLTLNNGTWTKQ